MCAYIYIYIKLYACCCDTLETSISPQEQLSNRITFFRYLKKKNALTFFGVERLENLLLVLWSNRNMQHQNYKCPETFWLYVRIEMFPFSDRIPLFAMKKQKNKGIFKELVFQVIDIFTRKQTPFEEFCLMRGLMFVFCFSFFFPCSMKCARGGKSCSLPELIQTQGWVTIQSW